MKKQYLSLTIAILLWAATPVRALVPSQAVSALPSSTSTWITHQTGLPESNACGGFYVSSFGGQVVTTMKPVTPYFLAYDNACGNAYCSGSSNATGTWGFVVQGELQVENDSRRAETFEFDILIGGAYCKPNGSNCFHETLFNGPLLAGERKVIPFHANLYTMANTDLAQFFLKAISSGPTACVSLGYTSTETGSN